MSQKKIQSTEALLKIDKNNIWHPYSRLPSDIDIYPVRSADGVRITLETGEVLIDGMSSWWCAIHGYNVPEINRAIEDQLKSMAHVMFGGLTHKPAIELTELLLTLLPKPLDKIFYCDSGSVAVEVAMKMAVQYWQAKGIKDKQKFLTLRGGYHGDTIGAMSVCDPVTGMHSLFSDVLAQQFFVERPTCSFESACTEADIEPMRASLEKNHQHIAAVILEPIVQGAGGMYFYSPEYLKQVRVLCDEFDVLLVADEIATGFGRTGRMFACEFADITPDIICIGKSMTGGYLSMAATAVIEDISETISKNEPHTFMHGPTYMANPLACCVAKTSIQLLLDSPWKERIHNIEAILTEGLKPCETFDQVSEVRVLGAIGVVEMKQPVDMKMIQPAFVQQGVWIRPFGRLIYIMPAFTISRDDLLQLTEAIVNVVRDL